MRVRGFGRTARRALGQRRARLQVHHRLENGDGREALSCVVEAAARQKQKDQNRSRPSHLVH
jgi:hypothetical protein